ncbi:recombination-associated protein RdgC [bacterium]|nr:recombination-associated protein RdgC [bacterium]
MPLRTGSISARRYVLQKELPETFARTATMAIRRYAYKPINADRGEKESFGWVNPRAPLEERFTWEDLVDGHLVFLAVRRDRKSFSKVLFRARRDQRMEQIREERSLSRITRQHRLAIEEELTIQMLKETSPTVAFTELVWDMNTGEVFLAATGNALCERITDLFTSTFDVRLSPQFPALMGFDYMAAQGLEENFDRANAALAEG